MRPRYMGPVFIKRRRRHHTFELDMGNSRHHNIYHVSRLKPFLGDASEGVPVDEFPVPDDGNPRTYAEKAKAGEKRNSLDADEKSWETWAFAEQRAFRPAERLNAAGQLEEFVQTTFGELACLPRGFWRHTKL